MIIDQLENAAIYAEMHAKIGAALNYLQRYPLIDREPGRYEIEGSDMFLLLQQYETREVKDSFWEAHQNYIDVQYMLQGSESMGFAHVNRLKVKEPYCPIKDFVVLEGEGDTMTVHEGSFAIFYPQDAHMPCLSCGKPEIIKKAVIKVPVI
ncbi:YhcH/YjgK/YiaL family protein [Paenibacillus sp. J5C_2022]|uniref:YhcH/YjgK/YiaL family protein n=1 Tax=Paenibacillus sp. J5C2022 TaxID=2977129 RepID=UPI0021CF329A|nr:YhcH/YjgK/YiaL family protein [Paenibacillus sp. J5C2022]MCU6711427.1 YhcH/YjgK/YiaL family protein [Paenibacillus sp. J5C2022]